MEKIFAGHLVLTGNTRGEPLTQADFLKGSRSVSGTTKRDRGNLASGRLCACTGNKLGRDAVAARPQ